MHAHGLTWNHEPLRERKSGWEGGCKTRRERVRERGTEGGGRQHCKLHARPAAVDPITGRDDPASSWLQINIIACAEGRCSPLVQANSILSAVLVQEWEEGDGEYVAPELLRGCGPSPAADVYSLGATVYECLTGRSNSQEGAVHGPAAFYMNYLSGS